MKRYTNGQMSDEERAMSVARQHAAARKESDERERERLNKAEARWVADFCDVDGMLEA